MKQKSMGQSMSSKVPGRLRVQDGNVILPEGFVELRIEGDKLARKAYLVRKDRTEVLIAVE